MYGHSIMFRVYWADKGIVARLLVSSRIKEIVIGAASGANSETLNKIYGLLIGRNLFPSEPNVRIGVIGETLTSTPILSCYLSYRYENNGFCFIFI